MAIGPRSPLASVPARRPPTGLVATCEAAGLLVDNDGPWVKGFGVEPEGCVGDNSAVYDPCDTSTTRTVSRDNQSAEIDWDPVELTTGDVCSAFSSDARDARGRAERTLAACESKLLAGELWAGTQAAASSLPNRFLADVANVDIVTEAGPVAPETGLACLEQALAECACGGRGMIHATPQAVSTWAQLDLVARQGPLMLSPNDHYIVADAGYPGTSPDGETPDMIDSVWAYATGLVQVRRAPVQVVPDDDSDAVDRTNNVITFRASRLASAWWDGCCHAGARLSISPCGIGGS